jgi:hypothetical protein
MPSSSRFSNMILRHWQTYRPQMVEQLQQSNQLTEAIARAESRAVDLLYEFLNVRKMQYQTAWDLAMQECLLPEEQTSPSTNPSEALTATSE